MLKVGLLVNPVAGCGQFLNLKGSDSLSVSRCPRNISVEKAIEFLLEVRDTGAHFYTSSGLMGEKSLQDAGIASFNIIHETKSESTPQDTRDFVKKLGRTDAEFLIFFGGDGTARDIIDGNIGRPVLGVPLGTKMFSSVFAISVDRAAQLFRNLASGRRGPFMNAEVIDLDEASYTKGQFMLSTYGSLSVPVSDFIMSESKAEYPATNSQSIAEYMVERMDRGVDYLVGPGSTCKSINSLMGLEGSLLGFDLVRDGKLIAKDLSEGDIFRIADEGTKIIISPIGGQGFLIGRGNKQLSGRIISKIGFEGLVVVASDEKLNHLRGLYIDLDDLSIPTPKFIKVLFSYGRFRLMPVFF